MVCSSHHVLTLSHPWHGSFTVKVLAIASDPVCFHREDGLQYRDMTAWQDDPVNLERIARRRHGITFAHIFARRRSASAAHGRSGK